jgi:hypothetical protein
MRIWLYKNNLDGHPDYVDPEDLFDSGLAETWGGTGDTINTPRSTRWVEDDMAIGDLVFMQRRRRGKTMIVGLATVSDLQRHIYGVDIELSPTEKFTGGDLAVMRKQPSSGHAKIDAFRPGPLDAIQPLSPGEAKLILKFVGSAHKI